MIEHFIFKWKLNKLYRKKEALHKSYLPDKKDLFGEKLREVESEEYHFAQEYDESIKILVTNYLTRKARRNFISIPEINSEDWEQCFVSSDRYILKQNAIAELQSRIRKEERERVNFAITIIIGCTGLIGALTGLVALIKK